MTMTMTTASASASVVGASRRAMGGKSVRASMVASIGGARRERVATYAGKGRGAGRRRAVAQMQQQVEQFMPPIDPDNEQFVIYVRSKRGIKAWYPLNVVTGGSAANTLVKGLDSSISKEMARSRWRKTSESHLPGYGCH